MAFEDDELDDELPAGVGHPPTRRAIPTGPRKDPGGDFEQLIKRSVSAFRPQGLRLNKIEPTVVGQHGAAGQVTGRSQGKGGLDFEGRWGHLWAGCEAKSTGVVTRFAMDLLEDHQVKRVARAHEDGAIAFVLVEVRIPTDSHIAWQRYRYFAIDWPTLRPWWEGDHGRASMPFANLVEDTFEVRREGRVLDVLAPVKWLAGRHEAARQAAGRTA